MTVREMIIALRREEALLAAAIATLARVEAEQRQSGAGRSRRGRKSIGEEERQEISRRMRQYWQGRRKARIA